MKISYNPKSSLTAITTETAANDDIIFDLYASKLWAKGVRIGADWADISSKPSSLKNPYALTISLNGTSQDPYDGSAAKSINITPSSIGAAVAGHNHDDRYYTKSESNAKYITDITTSVNKLTFTKNGSNINRDITVNIVYSLGNLTNISNKDSTTKASSGLVIYNSYNLTIGTNSYSSVLSINTGGTIQIAGNWGDDLARNLYWRSLSDRAVSSYPWKSWRTILDSENYSSTLDSRYYTESEVDSLLDAKLNRQNLSYGTWNPRGYNLAADYHYNGGDLSISESGGKIHISVDGYFWLNEGQYRVLDTSDVAGLKSNLTVHLYLSNTDTKWYPLIWGGNSHNNTSDSTGEVYKSYDKLSWLTSSLTLYATKLLSESLTTGSALFVPGTMKDATLKIYSGRTTDAVDDGHIGLLTSIDSTDGETHTHPTLYGSRCVLALLPRGGSVYIGNMPNGGNGRKLNVNGDIGLFNVGSIRDLAIGGGIYWNPAVESAGDGSDAASITVVRLGVAGGTTLVFSLMNDANDTILFQTNGSARLYHNNNFILTSKDTKVTSGKGYIDNTEITLVNNASKLQTARNLWGNSFDGTKDINGSIVFPNIEDTDISSKISWSGSSDGADIYYLTTGADLGNLVLNVKDDTNAYILLALNDVFKSHFDVANSYWTGRSALADKWTTARTFTIGNTAKNVDGSGNVSWSLSEIGVRDTWRTVQVNGTSIGNNTLNLCGSTYIGLTNVNGKVTFSLVGSGTTANQAILSNGTANGWTLKTLNIDNWDTAYNFVSTITGEDADNIINKWDEIVNFLAGITEDNKLNTLLNSKLSVYELANNTNVGAIKNNGIYYSTTDASSGTLTNSPFNTGFALINMTSYDGGDDLRRSRLAFNAYGEIKVSGDRDLANTAETWYNVLTSKNSGISGSTIKLNGTSITVYSSSTADSRYVKKSGDTMNGALNFANNIWNQVGDDVAIGDHNIAGCLGIKGLNADPGLAFYNSSNTLLSKLVGTTNLFLRISGDNTYNILDNSTTHINDNTVTINGTSLTVSKSDHNHDDKYLRWLGNANKSNMNDIGRISHSSGMTSLSDPGNTIDNPMEGNSKSTYWHLYWQTNYRDDPSGNNAWVAQIVNRAGTDRWWVRSRNGGTITNGTNWTSNWRFLVTAPTSGLGSVNLPVYINNAGEVALANNYPTSLKSPHALTLKANGTVLATYDGSSAKEANFTYANVGAASANHNHDNKYVRKWTGVYGSANKFLKLVIGDEKGWIRLEVSDSNNALIEGYGIYMIGWGWHGENNTDNLNVSCLYANNVNYVQALKVVRTSRNNYDFYFLFASGSSYPSYTINYSSSVSSIDCTVTAIDTIPTATWASSLSALQLNASQVDWSGITNKPSAFNPATHTHTVFKNNLMIKGTNGISDSASIHLGIGDSDTGFKWISDGKCLIYANNVAVGEWTSGGMNWFKNPTVNGNKIWNAGNDGPDSGLDADTVDGYHALSGRTFNGNINWSENWRDLWNDGANNHPWYGFHHSLGNRGVYSTTLSDYFGLTLKTGGGNISMTINGNVGIGLFDPIYKLLVAGNVYASDKITSAGFKHSAVTENANLYVLTADGGYTFLNLTSNELAHEFSKDITVTSEWTDIEDFYGGNLSFLTLPGTYIVLVYYTTNSANSMYEGYFSGIMSWYTGTTNSNNADEIVLHRVGHAYANTIYLRTRESLRDDPHPYTKLQISANSDLKQHTYKFKFKRIC